MDSIWLAQYPSDALSHIEESPDHLVKLLENSSQRFPERIAFNSFGTSLSYHDLNKKSDDFARWLYVNSGLMPGDRVALMLPNLLQYPVALFGVLKAGMVATNINPLYSARELNHQLKDSGAKLIIAFDNALETLSAALPETEIEWVIITSAGDLLDFHKRLAFKLWLSLTQLFVQKKINSWHCKQLHFRTVLQRGADSQQQLPQIDASELAILQYTGGTTGIAKGAMLTHRNLVANLMQMQAFFPILNDTKPLTIITAIPLFHIFSLTVNLLLFIKIGGKNVLIADPRKTTALIKTLKKFSYQIITGVDTLFNSLLNHPAFHRLNFSALQLTIGGGMPVHHITTKHWFETTSNLILQGYGLTEASPVVCVNPYTKTDFNDSVGLPLPDTQISIRSLHSTHVNHNGDELAIDEHGELYVHGPQVMAGYWQQSEETAAIIDEQGWLRTGDIAFVDKQGYVHIVGRIKDLILVSGFNVYPSEVEEVLSMYDGVIEVACTGIPDEHSGERVKAFVVAARPVCLTEKELITFCKTELADYKVPVKIEFRESLPKSNVGKLLHRKLRQKS